MLIYGMNAVMEAMRAGRARSLRVAIAERCRDRLQRCWNEAARHGVRGAARDRATRSIAKRATACTRAWSPTSTRAAPGRPRDAHRDAGPAAAARRARRGRGSAERRRDPADGGCRRARPAWCGRRGGRRRSTARRPRPRPARCITCPIADVVNIARAVEELKEAGVWTVGLDADAEMPYYEWDLTLPTALVVGAEGHGLRRLVRERCDGVASIPMRGHVGSLNVSAAAAIVLYEAVSGSGGAGAGGRPASLGALRPSALRRRIRTF